ncbi:MAG: CusA/CzcA family heavy metal efflux RND transporter [Gemmatimonadota bacterium]
MIRRLIEFSLRQPFYIAGGMATLAAVGLYAFATLPFEAFPDLTANSVSVIADAPGTAPQDVEQLVTYPIERSLLGLPNTESVRSTTKFGLAMTQVVFEDGVDPYFARQLVAERLANLSGDLPENVSVSMGPVATAMGEVYQYVLASEDARVSATDLKTLQDYSIAPQLRTVDGVAEVNSWGGLTEQYHVIVEPGRLIQAGLTLADVEQALAENNRNFGGTYTETRGERFIVRGIGRLGGVDDLADVAVATRDGVPIHIHDIATVTRGALPRQGAVTIDGEGEVVAGMVIMRKGANALRVLERVQERIDQILPTLPEGVRLVPFYNQGRLVEQTTHTIEKNLLLGGTLVVILLWGFLRNIAASVLVALVIPLSMLWAFVAMRLFGFSANLMSLGALDFGLLVDASVVVVENVMRKASEDDGEPALERIRHAALEVARPVLYGIAIIIAVYIPILALQGTEGKMFRPMAFTVVAAILGSLLLSLTFVPAAAGWFLTTAKEVHTPRFDRLRARYRSGLARAVPHPGRVTGIAGALFLLALLSATRLGTEFMPRLDEGSVLVQGIRLPSTALEQGTRFSGALERALTGLPEVEVAVSKLGRPDLATEAMGTYESDTYVMLKERSEWRRGGKDALLSAMDSALQDIPGLEYAFTQPIQMRLDEAETGITTDVGVKIFGDDPDVLADLAARVEGEIARVDGAADVKVTAASRVKELRLDVDRTALSRYGLSTSDIGHQVEMALGSSVATHVVDGPRRIGVVVRIPGGNAIDPVLMAQLPVANGPSGLVTLGSVADLGVQESPEAFAHEGGQRMVVVGANIRGRDVGSFVEEAAARLAERVPLPSGYRYEWGGQYQHQRTAMRRLALLVPVSILAIYLLLFSTFGSIHQALLIMLNVPFAIVGGIAALWLARLNLSTSALIGFIAVFGIAVLNGVVMVSYMNQLRERGASLLDAVLDGAATRLRPVLMTALAASLGFVPMALSTSPGAELQRPLASVVIGGLITATLLTLFVLPTVYFWLERWIARSAPAWLRRNEKPDPEPVSEPSPEEEMVMVGVE